MKHKYILYLFGILAVACNRKNNDSGADSIKVTDSVEAAEQSITPSILFGSDILATFEFPSYWEVGEDASEEDDTIATKYITAYQFYTKLIRHPMISIPEINHVEHLEIEFPYPSCVDSVSKAIGSIRYKLPNIGPYECYYSQQDVKSNVENIPDTLFRADQLYCVYIGNIILYSPRTKSAKVVNVFFSTASDISNAHRLFYVDKNKAIHTYRIKGSETSVSFQRECVIQVMENGQIEIIKNNHLSVELAQHSTDY